MLKRFLNYIVISTVSTAAITTAATGQQSTHVTNNIERAFTVVSDVYAEINYNNSVGDVKMHLKGTFNYEGESNNPGSVREYTMFSDIACSKGGYVLQRKDSFTRIGQPAILSSYNINEKNILVTEAGQKLTTTDADREKYLYQSLIFSPNLFIQHTMHDASRNTYINTVDNYHIIRHNNASGDSYYMFINTRNYYLERIEQPKYDPVIGDYFLTIEYSDYNIRDGYQTAGEVTIKRDSNIIYKLKIDVEEILPQVDYGMMRLSQKKIGSWLYLVPMKEWNTKAVIADMDDFLVVFEPPSTPEAGYTLIDNIKKAYPGKEIRYCVVSHHHPELMGGIRPFMEDGTIIVTTEGNKEYFQKIARNRHMYSKEVRVKKFISPKFMFVSVNEHEIKVKNKIIRFYLLNKKSHHTDEYILSYIPVDKILIEADLVQTTNLKQRALDKHERGLVEFIDAMKISVKEVVQTSPLEKAPHVFDYDAIKPASDNKLIQGSKKILEIFE